MRLATPAFVGHMVKGKIKLRHQRRQHVVIADHRKQARIQLAERVPHQDIGQTMVFLRRQNHDPLRGRFRQPNQRVRRQHPAQLLEKRTGFGRSVKFRPHEKSPELAVHELLVADHVEPAVKQNARDAVDQPRPIGAFNQQHP